jgi:hypothetical protein
MKNVSNKILEAIHTFVLSNFLSENPAIYEKMWKNIVERGRPQLTIWLMRIAYRILKATDTLLSHNM